MSKLREAWRKPPSGFHRWIAMHPVLYVALVVGVLVVAVAGTMAQADGLVVMFGIAILAAAGLAAWTGAMLTRPKVEQYDARRGD